jgi:hypothetical protein
MVEYRALNRPEIPKELRVLLFVCTGLWYKARADIAITSCQNE